MEPAILDRTTKKADKPAWISRALIRLEHVQRPLGNCGVDLGQTFIFLQTGEFLLLNIFRQPCAAPTPGRWYSVLLTSASAIPSFR
jgi:hypothetical protein